ncbi:MAG: hypothetical protein U0802_18865 [Candidatus Binatia bacterium]
MDEVELTQAAIFCLEQAARRIRTLADQVRGADLGSHLRALADQIDGHARDLAGRRPASG